MQSLALTYRPRTFDDLVGQRAVQVLLRRMVETHRVPQAILLDGAHGTGKTTTARILAAALNCEGSPVPCGQCVSCKATFDGTSLDLLEIDAASNGLVEDIRKLREQVLYDVTGNYRVVLLDEAHSCSRAAFDAMLKIFEEPPPNVVFVLLTTEPHRIPDTVASRLMPFTFNRITVPDIIGRLEHICAREQLDVEAGLLATIAERADGGLRDAIMQLDQLTRAGVTTLTGYTELTGHTDYGPRLVAALAAGKTGAAYTVADDQLHRTGNAAVIADTLAATLRDVLIVGTGGTCTAQGSALAARKALAGRINAVQATAALRVLWDLKTRMRVSDDPRIGLDLALAMLGAALAPAAPITPSAQPPQGTLNLAQMRTMADR